MKRKKKLYEKLIYEIINLKDFRIMYHRRSFLSNGLNSYSLLLHLQSMNATHKAIYLTLQIKIIRYQTFVPICKYTCHSKSLISVKLAMKILVISVLFLSGFTAVPPPLETGKTYKPSPNKGNV